MLLLHTGLYQNYFHPYFSLFPSPSGAKQKAKDVSFAEAINGLQI